MRSPRACPITASGSGEEAPRAEDRCTMAAASERARQLFILRLYSRSTVSAVREPRYLAIYGKIDGPHQTAREKLSPKETSMPCSSTNRYRCAAPGDGRQLLRNAVCLEGAIGFRMERRREWYVDLGYSPPVQMLCK